MARYSNALSDVFAAYGTDATAGLEAYANVDNEGWSDYVDGAAEMRYRSDYANWSRSLARLASSTPVSQTPLCSCASASCSTGPSTSCRP